MTNGTLTEKAIQQLAVLRDAKDAEISKVIGEKMELEEKIRTFYSAAAFDSPVLLEMEWRIEPVTNTQSSLLTLTADKADAFWKLFPEEFHKTHYLIGTDITLGNYDYAMLQGPMDQMAKFINNRGLKVSTSRLMDMIERYYNSMVACVRLLPVPGHGSAFHTGPSEKTDLEEAIVFVDRQIVARQNRGESA